MLQKNEKTSPLDLGRELAKNRAAVAQLAQSGDAQRLIALLKQSGGVQDAAKAAAAGDPAQLMARLSQLMDTPEGADLVQRISQQAKDSGLS